MPRKSLRPRDPLDLIRGASWRSLKALCNQLMTLWLEIDRRLLHNVMLLFRLLGTMSLAFLGCSIGTCTATGTGTSTGASQGHLSTS